MKNKLYVYENARAGSALAKVLSIGDVTVLITGEGHGERGVQDKPLGEFCIEGDGATG